MPKKSLFNFEFKVFSLMFIIVVIVIVTGITAYVRFTTLLENIKHSVKTDNRLALSNSLRYDLTELTNLAKTHTLTEDDTYRYNYNSIRNDILEKVDRLKSLGRGRDEMAHFLSIDTLVNDKLIVLDGIMYSEDPFRVQTALGKVVFNLEKSEKEVKKRAQQFAEQQELKGNQPKVERTVREVQVTKTPEKPLSTTENPRDTPLIKDVVEYDLLAESKAQLEKLTREERQLLKKIKRAEKKNQLDRVSELDSILSARKNEAKLIHKKLTKEEEKEVITEEIIIKETEKIIDNSLAIKKIYKGIEKVSTEELLIEKEIKMAQLELISMDNILSLKIARLFDEFELSENEKIAAATAYAEKENKKTNTYMIIFAAFVTALLAFIAYIIYSYVKRNNRYKLALRKSATEKEKLITTREKMMATISHEIRTPMHAISGFADELSKENLTEQQRDYLSVIQKSAQHLSYLVNDVLDYSKLQNRKLKLDKIDFDLKSVVEDVVVFSKQLISDDRLDIDISIDENIAPIYIGDPVRLRQILLNLMSNAVKFTDDGSVKLQLDLLKRDNGVDTLKLIVSDTGIGMTQEELATIFNEFEQAGKGKRNKIAGTGLGLSITRMLVDLHHGDLQMTSEKGVGTQIELKLEYPISSSTSIEVRNEIPQLKNCHSILVVDDEAYNRKLLRAIFSRQNVVLYEAINGQEALEVLKRESIDLILMDMRMPVMNGKETVKAILQLEDEKKRNVKVIMLTAAGNELDELTDVVSGCLPKPFTEEVIVNAINAIFNPDESHYNENTTRLTTDELKEYINFSNLKSLSGNDTVFYKDMLQTFIETTENSLENLLLASSQDDVEMIANEAHKMASPCKHLGATKLYGLLKDLEIMAREGQMSKKISMQIRAIDEEVSLVLEAVATELTTVK